MKRFKVHMTKKVIFEQIIFVEATDKNDAESEAESNAPQEGWKETGDIELECEAERANPPYDTVDFPAYALSALINDDVSGLSADDLKHLHNWTREVETRIRAIHGQDCDIVYDPGEEEYFSTAQVFGLPATCVELEIHVFPRNKMIEENLK